jgi:hypothetical protein
VKKCFKSMPPLALIVSGVLVPLGADMRWTALSPRSEHSCNGIDAHDVLCKNGPAT